MKKEYVPRRWRRFIPGRKLAKELAREAGSTAVLTGALAVPIWYFGNNFLESVKESVRQTRHAGRTVGEMVIGTPGERAASDLREFYDAMQREGLNLAEYKQQIRETVDQRQELVNVLDTKYQQNEKFIRQSERFWTQLEGATINATAAGDAAVNKITGGVSRKINDWFMDIVGSSEDARENLPKLEEIYKEAREFYDGREQFEYTVADVCNYLKEKREVAVSENKKIDRALDGMISTLDETYRVEGSVLSTTGKVSLVRNLFGTRGKLEEGEVSRLEEEVSNYQENVNEIRAVSESAVPIGPYVRKDAWIDYSINPLTVGLVGALAIKGLSSLTRPTRRALTTATLAPLYLAKKIGTGVYNLFPRESEELRSSGDT